ncbi:hypothetical protein KY339_06125 [Candidatus Woesearchaeota archaeon]|nr:hypothetical protein [Candidatus Woesearchaeota archaeon]
MAGRKTAKKGEVKLRKSSSKKPSKTKKEVKKGGFEMDKLTRKDFLKQAGIAGAALTAMAATGGKARAAAGGQSNIGLFLDRDASLIGLGVVTKEELPNSTITFAGVSYTLYNRIRTVLRNGMMFSTVGFFKVNNAVYMYYSNDPFERFAWFAKLTSEGIVAEGSAAADTALVFEDNVYDGLQSAPVFYTLTTQTCTTIFGVGNTGQLYVKIDTTIHT